MQLMQDFKIIQSENQFQDCRQCSPWVRSRSAS